MGFMKIPNLYKDRDILAFRECYASEKVHGTSAHVRWKDGEVGFFSGGAKHDNFVALFDSQVLTEAFMEFGAEHVVVYGEAYGGRTQRMSDTYGKELRFVVFDVKIGGCWLAMDQAERAAIHLGFEFIPYRRIEATLDAITIERDAPSEMAVRRGCGDDKPREGIVLRPVFEVERNDGKRLIVKYKTENFRETASPRPVDEEALRILTGAQAIAEEWVTQMRLTHVLDGLGPDGNTEELGMESMGDIIKAMLADIEAEAADEIVLDKPARKAIGARTVQLFKARLVEALAE